MCEIFNKIPFQSLQFFFTSSFLKYTPELMIFTVRMPSDQPHLNAAMCGKALQQHSLRMALSLFQAMPGCL